MKWTAFLLSPTICVCILWTTHCTHSPISVLVDACLSSRRVVFFFSRTITMRRDAHIALGCWCCCHSCICCRIRTLLAFNGAFAVFVVAIVVEFIFVWIGPEIRGRRRGESLRKTKYISGVIGIRIPCLFAEQIKIINWDPQKGNARRGGTKLEYITCHLMAL